MTVQLSEKDMLHNMFPDMELRYLSLESEAMSSLLKYSCTLISTESDLCNVKPVVESPSQDSHIGVDFGVNSF